MKLNINIGWLYPDLMSTYGDRGNVLVLQKRCKWRNIECKIVPITIGSSIKLLSGIDLIFAGGAQDKEQDIVMRDLLRSKGVKIKEKIEMDIPALFVCGAPQLMGNFYEPAIGKKIQGLGIFNIDSVYPSENSKRLIGNTAAKVILPELLGLNIFGFENHGGRTYLRGDTKPFAKVLAGYGNNGEDKFEGMYYKNAIGSYFHGPLLPKNPAIADFLIKKALEVKYKRNLKLEPLDDTLELKAQLAIANKLSI